MKHTHAKRATPSTRAVAIVLAMLFAAPLAAGGLNLRTLDGEATGLGALISEDKWTLVMVWTTYCGVCREQYPRISKFHSEHAASDAVVRGISLDGLNEGAKVARYREEKQHTFPSVLSDAANFKENYESWTEEGFTGTPTYLLFDPQRRLRAYLDGPITIDTIEDFMAKK